ncbi:uncharacterized protein Thert_02489 [Thermoanaerobacterium thermosaccharolyticum]|uniref:Uncharacterized protein n=1 Tax=Thermoanaerobacterium thermosaccharolyticum TaxID=1517 RepID=A0A223I100_THETR|nr:uncharacterized protein Thert_02489 [Thermoanaerobacterium thermosaccharolyticum]
MFPARPLAIQKSHGNSTRFNAFYAKPPLFRERKFMIRDLLTDILLCITMYICIFNISFF